ncbi:MAG TPA: hypothetical protein VD970_13335 [Acetobacteraceae bacterium]|nr:hypothetical protein [Acetobacteraceae bacterium]
MIRIPRLTLPRLLSFVEGQLRRFLPGRIAVPRRAYAAARGGFVSIIDLPETPNTGALAAILALEMAQRGTAMFVLVQADEADRIELVGHRLGREPRSESRALLIRRAGQKISGIQRLDRASLNRDRPRPGTERAALN